MHPCARDWYAQFAFCEGVCAEFLLAAIPGSGYGCSMQPVLEANAGLVEYIATDISSSAIDILQVSESAVSRRQRGAITMGRSEEHTSELQSLMRISYAVFCLKKKKKNRRLTQHTIS